MRKVMLILAMLALMCSAASAALAEEQASGSEPTPVEAMPAKEPAPTGEAALEKDGQGANGEESSVATPAAPDLAQPVEEKEAPGSEAAPGETMPAEEPAPVEEAAPEKDGQGANEEESATPAAPDLDAGIGVEPVRAPSDNADAPKNEHSSSSDSKEDPDAPKEEQSSAPEADPTADPPVQPQPEAAREGDIPAVEEGDKGYDSSGIYGPWMKGYSEGGDKGYFSDGQAANEEGDPQNGYSSNDVVGCPGDYEYDEDTGTCFPSFDGDLISYPVFFGDKPWPDSAGGYVGLTGGVVGDTFQGLGAILQAELGTWAEDALLWYGDPETAGPIGYPIQGLGYTIGFAGDAVGGLLEGAGQVVNDVAEGTGEVIDAVGGAVTDATETVVDAVGGVVDDIGSWFGW